jgi:hypothetical protein
LVRLPLVRRSVIAAAAIVALFGAVGSVISLSPVLAGDTSGVAMDYRLYVAYARQWLETGNWYAPAQLSAPYSVEGISANAYPPLLIPLATPFALGLPWPIWWAVPLVLSAIALTRLRPTRWGWGLMALAFCDPRMWFVLVLGNPALWAYAFALCGLAWGWPAVLCVVKLPLAPLALLGARDRRKWFVAIAILAIVCVPFGSLWTDYAVSLANARSERGLGYVLGDWPVLLLLLVGASSRRVSALYGKSMNPTAESGLVAVPSQP